MSETLTLGFGGIYDESLRGLAEIFFRPSKFPLQVAVSALAGDGIDVISDIRYEPSDNLIASFTSDRLSNRFNVNWRVSSGLSLFANTSNRNASAAGLQFNFSGRNFYTFGRASLDTDSNLRWNLLQRLGKLGLNLQGNEIGTSSELIYSFSSARYSNTGSALLLNYDTRSNNGNNDDLLTLGWRYRSRQRAFDGNYVWQAELGYGLGSQGNGIVATLGTTVLPGIMLQGRYQGVSLTRNDSSFSINLVSGLNLQQGIRPGDRRSRYFRTQGGLMIKPFLSTFMLPPIRCSQVRLPFRSSTVSTIYVVPFASTFQFPLKLNVLLPRVSPKLKLNVFVPLSVTKVPTSVSTVMELVTVNEIVFWSRAVVST